MACRHVIVTGCHEEGFVLLRFRILPPDYSGGSPSIVTHSEEEFREALCRSGLSYSDRSEVLHDLQRDGLALRIIDTPFELEDAAYFGWRAGSFFNADSAMAA